ncbi:peptidase S8/S53 domain-containing protein [Mycena rosella]|uniref:Peptidase S8/S53 domain-containing protein n=1 Tax=Mycena rosella TaxID=1033263 RepID=A0AAD7F9H8_MYCRO|nr:peptidase S8/S53 domain-containing protein [Mycena rosella]
MGLLRALPLVLLAKCVLSSTMVLHESISNVPSGFKASGSPSPNQEIKLFIALVQSNITGLAKVVDAVSIPSSPSYGQYLTAAEVAQYVKPPADSVSTVVDWVTPNVASVKPFSPAGDILQVSLTVEQAEGLFNTKFSTYTHSANGQEMIRALNYSLPSTVQQHILHVHPIIAFTSPPQRASQNTVYKRKATLDRRQLAPCEDIVRPVCIQEFYGIPNTTISGSLTNSIGVQGYNSASLGEYANNDDLATFLNEFRPDIAGNTFSVTLLNGAQNLQDNSGGLEGQIDIQYTVGVAGNDTINWLLSQEDPPTVFTTSYANEEAELTQSVSTLAIQNVCCLFAMATCNWPQSVPHLPLSSVLILINHVLGISMIFASGDGGASDSQQGCTSFVPMFPSTCPYVTSVGGTFFQPPTAFSSSAGGFSNYFPVPSYQAADTAAYLESIGDEYSGMYNPNGRGFPDVAAEWEVFIVNEGGVTSIGGTSCASPIFASFIALVNDRLIAAGKPVLGFLNPLLYSTGKGGLDDVTVGNCLSLPPYFQAKASDVRGPQGT